MAKTMFLLIVICTMPKLGGYDFDKFVVESPEEAAIILYKERKKSLTSLAGELYKIELSKNGNKIEEVPVPETSFGYSGESGATRSIFLISVEWPKDSLEYIVPFREKLREKK